MIKYRNSIISASAFRQTFGTVKSLSFGIPLRRSCVVRKFIEGMIFGFGFSLALLGVGGLGVYLFAPMVFRPVESSLSISQGPSPPTQLHQDRGPQFHELPIEEQIRRASVIALARFEPSADGKMKAIFREFLKKAPDTTIYYSIGDEYPSASYYPSEGTSHGDGLVVFFVGSPADMRMAMTYTGDRIHSLGDIPLELFRKKCQTPGA
jgi:hypothetical protein